MKSGLWLTLSALLMTCPALAQFSPGTSPSDGMSTRNCRAPGGAKQAQVLAFDKTTLEAKLAVVVDDANFKVVTVKIWDRSQDLRPIVPVMEAARITQGKLQFYTPNLDVDPEPVHDKQFLVVATLGGAQVCWATDAEMLKGANTQPRAADVSASPRR